MPNDDDTIPEALRWGETREGRAYLDAVAKVEREAWAKSRSEEQRRPEWAMTVEDVSRFPLGSRIRFTEDMATVSGVMFRKGEEATVTEHRLGPIGVVSMQARTDDGRVNLTTMVAGWESAS